jgi:hypothetical protein
MAIYSPLTHTRAAEQLITQLGNAHHRAILENYRRHALLEVAGRWQEILVPAMTVDHPVYWVPINGVSTKLDGMDAVAKFDAGLVDGGMNVFGPVHQKIAVADWGFAAEALFQQHVSGQQLLEQGERGLDGHKVYRVEWMVASAWHYTPDARLIGEHIYPQGTRTITEADAADLVTPEMAARLLEPVLAREVARELATIGTTPRR